MRAGRLGLAVILVGPSAAGRRGSASTLNTADVRERTKTQGIEVKYRRRVPAKLGDRVQGCDRTVAAW